MRLGGKREDLNYSGKTEWPASWRAAIMNRPICMQAFAILTEQIPTVKIINFL